MSHLSKSSAIISLVEYVVFSIDRLFSIVLDVLVDEALIIICLPFLRRRGDGFGLVSDKL
jgi:hypothetical protein